MSSSSVSTDLIRWFDEIGIDDVDVVGGKNASLGEMYGQLAPRGVRIPPGFATTADAFRAFMETDGLGERISATLARLDTRDVNDLRRRGSEIRHAILESALPADLERAVDDAYQALCRRRGGLADVAVRSSATAEDLPDASFAGQQETYLNVCGKGQLLDTCRRCFASLFTDRAISYREHHGFDHAQVALSVGIQTMVRSDCGASGVMFSIDTESGFRDVVLINATFGLGESVVQGTVNPDEYYVFKPTLKAGFRPILKRTLGTKETKLIYDVGGNRMTRYVPVLAADRQRFAIDDEEALQLAEWACVIEDHYSDLQNAPCPMDIEWAKDGETGELYIVQARPETVRSRAASTKLERYHLKRKGVPLVSGSAVGERIGQGKVRHIADISRIAEFQTGEVLVTDKTDPDWEPIMKKAAAIVTNRGGRTCHAAIVSRELGLPAVVGTSNATELLIEGRDVTVSCAQGDIGVVYDGALPFEVEVLDLAGVPRPQTKIMMNVANPDEAFKTSLLPNDGVGLAREEFIVTNYVKVHPLALLNYEELSVVERAEIDALTVGYPDKCQFYVDRLAQGVGTIAAAFYPKDVILRLSDFKTNEYANLVGGVAYEPKEENPMIGFRGASRYYSDRFRAAFALECAAIVKVRDTMGLKNLKLMVPFCRTVEEGKKVIAELERHDLKRGQDGLEVYVMCEIPSNVVLADEFCEIFDGFSVGSNDLTQLVLGVDRDSEIVAHVFDERNEAVKRLIASVIKVAKANGRKIGICGQAPSDFPEFAQFLVEQGIDSISLTPDVVLRTTLSVLEFEKGNGAEQPRG